MINATRELRRSLKDFEDNELDTIGSYKLKLTMSIMFPKRDFFDIYYNNFHVCSISKNTIYSKLSESQDFYKNKFYKETNLTKHQVAKIERIAEEWTKKYSSLMI